MYILRFSFFLYLSLDFYLNFLLFCTEDVWVEVSTEILAYFIYFFSMAVIVLVFFFLRDFMFCHDNQVWSQKLCIYVIIIFVLITHSSLLKNCYCLCTKLLKLCHSWIWSLVVGLWIGILDIIKPLVISNCSKERPGSKVTETLKNGILIPIVTSKESNFYADFKYISFIKFSLTNQMLRAWENVPYFRK